MEASEEDKLPESEILAQISYVGSFDYGVIEGAHLAIAEHSHLLPWIPHPTPWLESFTS